MQLRMSPGGSICSSSRKRPELPPSSETVTIAESESIHPCSPRLPTKRFKPASKVDKPVPPPIVTSLRPPLAFSSRKYCAPESLRCAVQNNTRKVYGWEYVAAARRRCYGLTRGSQKPNVRIQDRFAGDSNPDRVAP